MANQTLGPLSVVAMHSGKVLDVQAAAMNSGAFLQQWTELTDHPNQEFIFEDLGDGFSKITAKHSGKVLDVGGASTAEGARIIQSDWHGGDNQQFALDNAGENTVVLPAKHSGLVLDVKAASTQNGAIVQQWPANGGQYQRWTLNAPPSDGGAQSYGNDSVGHLA
jgi:hypothetical protein